MYEAYPPEVTMRVASFKNVACLTCPSWQYKVFLFPLNGSMNTRLGKGTASLHQTRT